MIRKLAVLAAAATLALALTGCQAEPTPTQRPTATHEPTATPSALPAPVNAYRPLIQAYAFCQGKYTGSGAEERAQSISEGLQNGQITPAEVSERTQAQCPTPPPRPTPTATPEPTTRPPPSIDEEIQGPAVIGNPPESGETPGEGPGEGAQTILDQIQTISPEAAETLGKMQFLTTQDAEDETALKALLRIGSWDVVTLNRLAEYLALNAGIQDEDTTAAALTYQNYVSGNSQPEDLYRPGNLNSYGIAARLPHGGIKLFTAASYTLDAHDGLAEAAAQSSGKLENWHGLPLLETHILTAISDALPQSAEGMNNTLTVTLSETAEDTKRTLMRELARFWWNGNQPWLDEGLTSLLAAELLGREPRTEVTSCPRGTTISWLEERESQGGALPQPCTTDIGEAYLQTLKEEAGEPVFRARMSSLLAQRRELEERPGHRPPKAGLAEIRNAFADHQQALEIANEKWDNQGTR